MATLTDKIENALNETRILVLSIQILIGFGFRTFFEPGFEKMAATERYLELASLGLLLLVLALLMIPVPYHRLVLQGRNTLQFHGLATATVTAGLLPFALAMSISVYLAMRWLARPTVSALAAGLVLALALYLWYGLELLIRKRRRRPAELRAFIDRFRGLDMADEEQTNLDTRIKQALIECRVVLPGAQALLGFQLIIMWMSDFLKIPQAWKWLHLASLFSVAVCTILLIMPAAYHRIVEQGEDSEQLHTLTSRALLWAMVFLALGVAGDFFLVARLTGIGGGMSTMLSCALLMFCFGSWFGFSLWQARHVRAKRFAAEAQRRRAA